MKFRRWFKVILFVLTAVLSGTAQSFLPDNLSGLEAWYSADSINQLNASPVSFWQDNSANANHLVQSNPTEQPVFLTGQLHAKPSVHFDGIDDFLDFSDSVNFRTIFIVGISGDAVFSDFRGLIGGPLSSASVGGYVLNGIAGTSTFGSGGSSSGYSVIKKNNFTTSPHGNFGTINSFWIGEFGLASNMHQTADLGRIDNGTQAGRFWLGDFAEIIVYDRVLLSVEADSVFNYLHEKYSDPVSAGADINIPYGFCDTILTASTVFASYQWSSGASTQSALVNKSGAYWVNATDIFGYVSSDTVVVSYPPINVSHGPFLCAGDSIVWNTNLPHADYSFSWQDNSLDSFFVVKTAGVFYVTVSDTNSCSGTSDTLFLALDSVSLLASLGPDLTFCGSGSVQLASGNSLVISYLWSDLSNNDSLSVNATGQYSLIATSANGCVMMDTLSVVVHALPVFSLGVDSVICYNVPFVLNPGLGPGILYQWSDGSSAASLTVNTSGTVWLNVTDTNTCVYADTVQISVDSSLASFTPGSDTTFCSGNYLVVNGTGSSPFFNWSDASTNDSLQIVSAGQYWVQTYNAVGCSRTDTVNVQIKGTAPLVMFNTSTNVCLGTPSDFFDATVPIGPGNLSAWSWSFGDTVLSALQNPSHVYADTGFFTVSLTVLTDSGCVSSVSSQVHVLPNPQAGFVFAGVCAGDSTFFTDQSLAYGYAINDWQWNFGDPTSGAADSSSFQSPYHAYTAGGTDHVVQLIVQNGFGCRDTLVDTVSVKSLPVASFATSLLCDNVPVVFTNLSNAPGTDTIVSANWNFGDGNSSFLFSPQHTYGVAAAFSLSLTVVSSNGCDAVVQSNLIVHQSPQASFPAVSVCQFQDVLLTDSSIAGSGSIVSGQWWLNGALISSQLNQTVNFSNAGFDTVSHNVIDVNGCSDTLTLFAQVNPKPQAAFTYNPNTPVAGQNVSFTNTSNNAQTYFWNFGDATAATLANPSHTYLNAGTYTLSLFCTSAFGCSDTLSQVISVDALRLDVSVEDIVLAEQSGFWDVTAQITNNGNTDVSDMELFVQVSDGAYFKESWTGLLAKGASVVHQFSSQVALSPAGTSSSYLCVIALKPNAVYDDDATNNELCRPLSAAEFSVYSAFPVPASDLLTLPLNLPKRDALKIEVYDARGRLVMVPVDGTYEKGMMFFQIPVSQLADEVYVLRVMYRDRVETLKFIKGQ